MAARMLAQRENTRYLPGISLPAGLAISAVAPDQLAGLSWRLDVVVIATPMAALRQMLATGRLPCPGGLVVQGL